MRKLTEFVMPIKVFAAMIFFGLIGLYVASGILYAAWTGEAIEYAVPFVFVFQSAGLSAVIALLWGLFFGEGIFKNRRFFLRYTLFALSMLIVLAICFFTFLAVPAEWIRMWSLAAFVVFAGTTVFLSFNELYYKRTGERYVEILNAYKKSLR
ncbi:MAG: hypothetical protein FWE12_04005 [Oscillospiraceae bacterium]|nr:hypothetical protein [Oscillospiraceae bacterium]